MTILKAMREYLGRTVPEHARAVGVYPTNVYRIEAGTAPAGPQTRERFVFEFGVPERELFDEAGWAISLGSHRIIKITDQWAITGSSRRDDETTRDR